MFVVIECLQISRVELFMRGCVQAGL
jgi:hypothetical protein